MPFCAFQALIRIKMHVLCLYPPYFDFQKNFRSKWFFYQKSGEERHKTCFFVCFRAWYEQKCMAYVFPRLFLIWKNKTIFKQIGFFRKKYDGESLSQAFLYVSVPETHANACLRSSPTKFWFYQKKKKTNLFFFSQKGGGGQRACFFLGFLRPETHKNAFFRSSPTTFWWNLLVLSFFFHQNVVGEDLRHAFCAFQALIHTKNYVLCLPHHILIITLISF